MSGAPTAAAAGPAIAALRMATADQHRAIEALLQLAPPAGGDGDGAFNSSLERYAAVLHGFDRFLSWWEPRLLAALPAALHDWFQARSRHGLLRQDLRELAARRPAGMTRPEPAPPDLPLPGPAAAFGSMYVLEGSALGGQVIARAWRQAHGEGTWRAVRYFTGHGTETGRMWHEFRELLARELDADPAAIQSACRAAVGTFEALIACFEGTPAVAARR